MNTPTPNLAVKVDNLYMFTSYDKILRFSAKGSYAIVHMTNGEQYKIAKNLKTIEKLLEGKFFRTHRSHLVNPNYIMGLTEEKGSILRMTDKSVVPITQTNRKLLLAQLDTI